MNPPRPRSTSNPARRAGPPLTWSQVKKGLDPLKYTLRTVPPLIAALLALDGYREAERPLAEAMRRLGKA